MANLLSLATYKITALIWILQTVVVKKTSLHQNIKRLQIAYFYVVIKNLVFLHVEIVISINKANQIC